MSRFADGLAELGLPVDPVQLGLPLGGESDMALWYRARELGWDPRRWEGDGVDLLDGWRDDAVLFAGPRPVYLPAHEGIAAWRAWYQRNASHWDEVEDIEGGLRGYAGDDPEDGPVTAA